MKIMYDNYSCIKRGNSISNVINKSSFYGDPIVVDDGSTDQTRLIAIKKG